MAVTLLTQKKPTATGWLDSIVTLADQFDIDHECQRWGDLHQTSNVAPTSSSSAAATVAAARLVNEVSQMLHSLTRTSSSLIPDQTNMNLVLALSQRVPHIFRLPPLTQLLLSWMSANAPASSPPPSTTSGPNKTTTTTTAHTPLTVLKKKSPQLAVLAVQLLDSAYRILPPDVPWPLEFVRVTLEDFFDQRNWVENEAATGFMKTITAAFRDFNPGLTPMPTSNTTISHSAATSAESLPSRSTSHSRTSSMELNSLSPVAAPSPTSPSTATLTAANSSSINTTITPSTLTPLGPNRSTSSFSTLVRSTSTGTTSSKASSVVINRFPTEQLTDQIRVMAEVTFTRAFKDAVQHQVDAGRQAHQHRPVQISIPLHFLRFLCLAAGYRCMRYFTILNIEAWLNQTTTNRIAKRLLILTAEEMGKAFSLNEMLPAIKASFDEMISSKEMNAIPKPAWSDIVPFLDQVTSKTFHSWSESSSRVELHSLRILMQLGLKVRVSGVNQSLSNNNWDETYLEAMQRILRIPQQHQQTDIKSVTQQHLVFYPIASLHPAIWRFIFHLWLQTDWTHAASMQGINLSTPSSSSSMIGASSSTMGLPSVLNSPHHFIFRLLDSILRSGGNLLQPLLHEVHSILDKSELMRRFQFVLRRVVWLNSVYELTHKSQPTSKTTSVHPDNKAAYLDIFQFMTQLLTPSSYPTESVLHLKEPLLTDAPTSLIQSYQSEVLKYQFRREVMATELVNCVVWCCILSNQPIQCRQAANINTTLHAPSASPATTSLTSSATSMTMSESGRPFQLTINSAAIPMSSPINNNGSNTDVAIRDWRYAIADIQAKSLVWIQDWLIPALNAVSALPSTEPISPTSSATTTSGSQPKDASQLFAELLSACMFLHASPVQFLQPFMTSAPSGSAASSPIKPASSSSSASYLAELWSLDLSFLKKACSTMLDKLPLLEETITRLIQISLAYPARLPHAHTIQIMEILLRRACVLGMSVGRMYILKSDEDDAKKSSHPGILQVNNDQLLEQILELSQFPTPIPPPIPTGQSFPPILAQSALFWRSCILLVILSAFNPDTIGRRVWEQVPILRCLLEMIVSEIWLTGHAATVNQSLSNLFPPFPDLISKSLLNHKVNIEIESVLFVENLLPDNRTTPRTRESSLYLSHNYLMLLDPSEIIRRPPEHILLTIQKLVTDFQLGSYLRSSKNPNFLSNMLSRQTPEQYVQWIKNLVLSEPAALEHLPINALTELMLTTVEKVQFEAVKVVLNGGGGLVKEVKEEDPLKRKVRALNRPPSLMGGTAFSINNNNPTPSTSATADSILDHLPTMITIMRRLLPNISAMYGVNPSGERGEGSQMDITIGDIHPPIMGRSSIMSVMSPTLGSTTTMAAMVNDSNSASRYRFSSIDLLSPTSPLSPPSFMPPTSTAASSAAPIMGSPAVTTFNHTTFIQILSMFLMRLNSRSPSERKQTSRALHLWLCPHQLPKSFGGSQAHCGVCKDISLSASIGDLSSTAVPALPPATCWLKFFFTWFLHAYDVNNAPTSAPAFSGAFLAAGRLVIRKLCTSLMCALEVENDPDTLFGYITFLHATATRFSYSPLIPPSKLFSLDLALRFCDVVLAREIIGEKLLAPVSTQPKPSPQTQRSTSAVAVQSPAMSPADHNATKRRRMTGGSPAIKPSDEPMMKMNLDQSFEAASSEQLPDLDLGLGSIPQLVAHDSVTSIVSHTLSLPTSSSSSASPLHPPQSITPTLLTPNQDEPFTGLVYSGYALIISVLSSAYSVIEFMQEDEKFVRRMLAREQKKANRWASSGMATAGATLVVPDSLPVTPMKALQMKRSRSQMEEEDLLDEDEPDVLSNTLIPDPGAIDFFQRGSTSDEFMDDSNALNTSTSSAVGAESVDEEFVSLHRSWPTCTQPILAYFPLALLHGIIGFLAFPYALPTTSNERADSDSHGPLARAFQQYQHLLSILLPPTPSGYATSLTSDTLPPLPVKSDSSWLIDHAGVQWPLPSELQGEQFLERSTTPMLLLLAIEVCSPNHLLIAMTQFGFTPPFVRQMLTKLDGWANYQIRLQQRQQPSSIGLPKSGSVNNLAMSPAMRELITHLPKIIHFVELYQSVLTKQENAITDSSKMEVEETTTTTTSGLGTTLITYLQSLSTPSTTIPATISKVQMIDNDVVDASDTTFILELLSSPTCFSTITFHQFATLQQFVSTNPIQFLELIVTHFDRIHIHLFDLTPLILFALKYDSLTSDSVPFSPSQLEHLRSHLRTEQKKYTTVIPTSQDNISSNLAFLSELVNDRPQ